MSICSRLVVGIVSFILFLTIFSVNPLIAASSGDKVAGGVQKMLFSVFEIPSNIVQHSKKVPFPFGLISGTISGTFKTVAKTVGGAADIAEGAAPIAKYAAVAA